MAANYDEMMVKPMREELSVLGFNHLMNPQEVEDALDSPGTTLLVVNSVCGCAAGAARPGVAEALGRGLKFDHLVTVFAGMEKDAVEVARTYFEGAPPSSPQAAILKDGQLLHLIQRQDFLGHDPAAIADRLEAAYKQAFAKA